MGNSHSQTTFIPEIIDDILGTESIHVNSSGESIFQTIYEYREVLRRQDPQMVVIETFALYSGLMNFYLPFTLNHAIWKEPAALFSIISEEWVATLERWSAGGRVALSEKGYVNYLRSMLPDQMGTEGEAESVSCLTEDLTERLAVVEEIIHISREEPGGVIFLEAPQVANAFEGCRPQAEDFFERQDVPHAVLMDNRPLPLLYFGDDEHMTMFGAVIASVETAEHLSRELDIPMKPEELSYYRSYIFTDYVVEQSGDQLYIELVPAAPEALKDLVFTWEISIDGESKWKTEKVGKNAFSYTLPQADGEYFVYVLINNPTGPFYLRGGFTIKAP